MANVDPAVLRTTRQGLHAVAEHVLAAARYGADGHIGLRQTPGGFGTPPFSGPAGQGTIRVETGAVSVDLVASDGGADRRAPLTTLRAAGELAGVTPGAPADVYTPATALDLDAPLDLDREAAGRLADWYALVEGALERLTDDDVAAVQLWPEHFDLATSIDEVGYGGSPGDAAHALPYLYVGPWTPPTADGGYWNEPFGASLTQEHIRSVDDAVAFFREGRARLARDAGTT